MDIVAIRGKTLTFLGEWVSSSLRLLFDPTAFIPPPGKRTPAGAAQTSATRKQIGFAASAVFVAITIFQIVARRSDTGSVWDSVRESLPFSLLVVGSWVLWSGLLALILKAFGGAQPPLTNVLFGVRALATFYVISMLVGTMAFLALGNQWPAFQWAELLTSFGLYTVYCPLIFGHANGFGGTRLGMVAATLVFLSLLKSLVGFGAMTFNPFVVPLLGPHPAPEPAPQPEPTPQPKPLPAPPQVRKDYAPALGNLVIEGGYGATGLEDVQVKLTKQQQGPAEFLVTLHYGPLWCRFPAAGAVRFVSLGARLAGDTAWRPVGRKELQVASVCPRDVPCTIEQSFTHEFSELPEQLLINGWPGCW